MSPIRIALVGIGKIARDQHAPSIAADSSFELVATASRHGKLDGVPNFESIQELTAAGHDLDAVALCTPPAGRSALAKHAIQAGLHVMLEKPPATTLGEADELADLARMAKVTLFASWHSRAAAAVEPVRCWLEGKTIRSIEIAWLENIRQWHPGQEWILGAGGFGVFDPGINALSILTAIVPDRVSVDAAIFEIPSNRIAPIAATLTGRCGEAIVRARFDALKGGLQQWTIRIECDGGIVVLADGGSRWSIDEKLQPVGEVGEYPALYRRFARLIAKRRSDADFEPLRIVADAFLQATPVECAAFEF